MKLRKLMAGIAASVAAVASLAVAASAYNGYLCFQTGVWSYRNTWSDPTVGRDSDYYNCMICTGGGVEEGTYPDYDDYYDYDLGNYAIPVDWTNANITGAGTYTVAIDNFDWALDGAESFHCGFVSTDIPEDAGLSCTSITVYIDGEAKKTWTGDAVNWNYKDNPGYLTIMWSNEWNEDHGWNKFQWTDSYPTSNLKVEFTLEGGDTAAAVPATGDVAAATDSSKGSPDTGIEDVAAVAGLALVAAGAIVVAKKRK